MTLYYIIVHDLVLSPCPYKTVVLMLRGTKMKVQNVCSYAKHMPLYMTILWHAV